MSLNILVVTLINVCVLTILLHVNAASGQGFFTMQVLLETYRNPTSEDCDGCNCEVLNSDINIFCHPPLGTCDNIFTFCLRIADTSQCTFGSPFTSAIYENDDFSFTSRNVLRQLQISNPLTFSSIPAGEPLVLDINIFDDDLNPNDMVDTISLSFSGITTTSGYSQSVGHTGRCDKSTIQLRYRISCAQGFEGPRCDCVSEPGTYICDVNGIRRCVEIQFAAPPECVECIEGYHGPRCDCMDQPGQYTCNLNGTRQCTFPFTGPLCDDCVSGYSGQTCNCTDQPGRYTCNFDGTVNCTGNFTTESLCTTCLLDHYKNDCSVYCSTLNFPGYKCDVDGILVYICESFIDPRCSMTTIIYIVIACFTLLPGLLCLCFIVVAQVNKKRNKDTY